VRIPGVADVERRALAACPQACGGNRFTVSIDADDDSRVGTAKNCTRQAAEPAAHVEQDLVLAYPAKIQDRLRQSLALAAHEALVPACKVHHGA
jgi:hypothetical protein